ncbi:glycoside hydrolase family 10 protein [Bacteroides sp. 224]|uniref:glycoside hydrolase family 10 protein n=1 Tax=Bacteroides sp. 224 TaxID=2302936 RepID=UPI0013D05428|nr:family 10 glycosylhydrolase [Bacteroides sp. 224]NDV66146.1 S-layer protein [Bacteroides sp. 224]
MRNYIFLFLVLSVLSLHAQPKHEVRAAWVTTAYALDWPKTKATSPSGIQKQKAELIDILNKLYEANFNTVLFQTRTRGDVFYQSSIEPYSAMLTGQTGKNPGYDPLAFVIEECHKRGMECHAWIVAIPLGDQNHVKSLGKQAITQKQPAICSSYKKSWYLNPGHKETKEYLFRIANEIITHYDIDGIHLDYLRYPENAPNFPDTKEFRKYGAGKNIKQWRRDNITEILRHIYKGVKQKKPWVKVSTSPVGKYRDTGRYLSGGWNAYHAVYQDAQGWLAEGIQDQIYPMMYFRQNHFYPFALDWQENCNGRHIIPGLGIYFLDPKEGNWKLEDVERQINFTRKNGLAGQAYYRVQHLMNNTQGLYDELNEVYYDTPALQPPMTWLDNTPPTSPTHIRVVNKKGYITLHWTASTDNDSHNAPRYVIYGSNEYPVDISKPSNILATAVRETEYTYAPVFPWERKTCYAITAIDRYGNESDPVQIMIQD